MRSSIIALAAAVASCTAREDLMFLPGFGSSGTPVVATVLEAGKDVTTYIVGCPAASDATRCRGYEHPIIATQGQFTAHFSGKKLGMEGKAGKGKEYEYEQDYACKLDPASTVCTISYSGPYVTHKEFLAEHSAVTTYTLNAEEFFRGVMKVPIVTDTASILNYGTDVHGKSTSYVADEKRAGPTSTGTDVRKAAVSTQTATTASPTELGSDQQERSTTTSTPKRTRTEGPSDAQITGLQVLAAVAFGGLIIAGAM